MSSSNSGIPVDPGAAQPFPGGGADIILGKVNEFYEMQTLDQSVWSTYYGGSWGDQGVSVIYNDVNDRLTLVGELAVGSVEIPNFPLAGNPASYSRPYNGISNGFIAFFDPVSGQRRFLSRLPGQTTQGRYIDVDHDAFGNTYVLCGGIISIESSEMVVPPAGAYYQGIPTPVNNGDPQHGNDGFIMQFDANANLIWRTFFGGPNNDYAEACAVDRTTNRLTIVGVTTTANTSAADECTAAAGYVELPMCGAGGQFLQSGLNSNNTQGVLVSGDGFIAQFDLDQHKLVWSTYFGGPGHDGILDVASNGSGVLYVVGFSRSSTYSTITCGPTDAAPGFPVCDAGGYFNEVPAGRKFFIAKFAVDNTLQWCTRFGDASNFDYTDSQLRITTNEEGMPLVFGSTVYANANYTPPLVPTILINNYNRGTHNDVGSGPKADCFVGLFTETTELLYCTYFGGIGNDLAGAVEAFDGRIYIGGSLYAGMNFPTHEPEIDGHDPYLDEMSSATENVSDAFLAQLRYDFTIGLNEHQASGTEGLLLYPNPTSGILSVLIPVSIRQGTLEVTDGLGRTVLQQRFVGNGRQGLDLGGLANGSYVITLRSDQSIYTGRIVKRW
ncbi:MAG: T9SS type A sorting domain-containing protein [Flavobacteriales bacterium]|nr:T9SS type A sorting domain-containing protein [Flavobacteriales bacterium]